MNNIVYVAYAHYFFGGMSIIGVYHSSDDAKRHCEQREKECNYCDYADWEAFVVQ